MFRIIALLAPLLLLLAAEGICRLAGFGGYPPVLTHVADDGADQWYATNRPGTDTFFDTRRSLAGGMRELHFTTPTPPDTVRIVFLGGSAVQGFPQVLPLTNGSFLKAMLDDAWSGVQHAEVLNFGATAVASFPVRCMIDELLEHKPDLVVVMTGHNEFYGAYGVASLHTGGRSPTAMRFTRWLRRQALTQWVTGLFAPGTRPSGTLMEQVAARQHIGPHDRLRSAAEASLRANLTAVVQRCHERDIPVIVCTLPTNERGMAPIGRMPASSLAADSQTAFERKLAEAQRSLPSDGVAAERLAGEAVAICSTDAAAHYLRGKSLTALGNHAEALAEYVKARDLDPMPWRATNAAQRAVRDAAATGGILCDMEAAFRADSPGGSIGWELMDDHVHLSLRGQALFARTIGAVMSTLPGRLHVDKHALARLPDWRTYADRLGHDIYTDYVAAERIQTLFGIPFMSANDGTGSERTARLVDELLSRMTPRDRDAVARRSDPSLQGYTDYPLSLAVGGYRYEDGDYAAAARLFQTARECVPAISLWRIQSTWYLLKCRQRLSAEPAPTLATPQRDAAPDDDRQSPEPAPDDGYGSSAPAPDDDRLCREAIAAGRLLLRHAKRDTHDVQFYLGMLHHFAGDDAAALALLEDAVRHGSVPQSRDALATLTDAYLRLGRTNQARDRLRAALPIPHLSPLAQQLLLHLDATSPAP